MTLMKRIQANDNHADRARFVFWKHLQLFKHVWIGGAGLPQAGPYSGLQWIEHHERFCAEHRVCDPLLRRVLAEFIQYVSDTGGPDAAIKDVLAAWDARFDTISMTDDEIQHLTSRYIFARPELFDGITNDIAANREILRNIAAEKVPAFAKQAYSFTSAAAITEYFKASR